MPTVVTNEFKFQEGGQNVNISGDTWICSLMNGFVNSASSDQLKDLSYWEDATSAVSAYEASGTGYTSGVTLTNVGWYTTDSDNRQRLSADDVSWANVTIEAYGVSIRRESDGLVMGFVDFGKQNTSNGSFSISWNSDGILVKI